LAAVDRRLTGRSTGAPCEAQNASPQEVSMNSVQGSSAVKGGLDRLTLEFFQSGSFTPGSKPDCEHI